MPHYFLLIFFSLGTLYADLLPRPQRILAHDGRFLVDSQNVVVASEAHQTLGQYVSTGLRAATGFAHRIKTPEEQRRIKFPRAISLIIGELGPKHSYRIKITPKETQIIGNDYQGLNHGVHSFLSLLPLPKTPLQRFVLPSQTIEDWPATSQRGLLLGTGGHLTPSPELKNLIAWAALHKINEFYLHLHSDHGWRMESKAYPKLHQIGSIRKSTPPYGDPLGSDGLEYAGYYTRENLKELVAFAKSFGVSLRPSLSFDHGASPILAAYPELSPEKVKVKSTWEDWQVPLPLGEKQDDLVRALLEELLEIFPDAIRVEVTDPSRLQLIKDLLASHNRQLIEKDHHVTTDFSTYNLPADTELTAGNEREAFPGLNTLTDVYHTDYRDAGLAILKTPYVHDRLKLYYQLLPRLAAFGEATWTPAPQRDYQNFLDRLPPLLHRYRASGVFPAAIYTPPPKSALNGVKVTTTMTHPTAYPPHLAYDGINHTYFRAENIKEGQSLTFEFPHTLSGEFLLVSGIAGRKTETGLEDGIIEVSKDGLTWEKRGTLILGEARADLQRGNRFIRITATLPQEHPFILYELAFTEPFFLETFTDRKEIRVPPFEKEPAPIEVTLEVNIADRPDLRETALTLRSLFFETWNHVVAKLAVKYEPKLPKTVTVSVDDLENIQKIGTKTWIGRHLYEAIHQVHPSSPSWLATGLDTYFRTLLDENLQLSEADPGDALEGSMKSAAFIAWLETEKGEGKAAHLARQVREGLYKPEETWRFLFNVNLPELLKEYQEQ